MKRSLILFNFLFFIISNSIGATYSGTCGDPNANSGKNVNWTLNNGTLTISGSGAMLNYTGGASSSSEIFGWSDYRYEITSVVISSGVTNVGASAFVNCSSLSSVTLASTVTKIGDDAFNGCKQLKEITLPSSCSSIGERAFQNTKISSITFPSSLTSIGAFAFMNSSLETVTCKASTPPTLGSLPFGYWDVTTLWVNDVDAYKASDWNDYFSKIVKIGTSGEATIGGSCGTNVKWSYADGVLTISGTGAMDDFYHSYGYDSRPWSTYVDDITSIIIEEGVTYIGKEAFRFCDNYDLTSIILPSTITAIGDYAFYYCDNLDVIKCEATTPPTFGSLTFESVYATLYVHDKAVYKDSSWDTYFDIKQIGLMEYTLQLKYDYAQGIATGSGTYDEGQEVTIEAAPRYRYKFVKWSDGNTDNPRTLTINKDLTLTAEFAIEEYEVVIESEGNGHVTGSGTYEHGSEVTITATPDEHYHFCGWSDGSTDNPRTLTIIQDKTLTAEFCINRYSVKFESDPNQGYAYGLGEDYLWGSTSVDAGEQITIQAYPKNDYTFVNWSDGNTENPRTLTITQDTVLKPEFAISKYQLTIESAGNGSISGSGTYEHGSEVTITATPDEHHHFVAWSDGNTDNPRNIKVTENTTISATFAIDEHQLTIAIDGNGSVSGSGTYEYGSEVTITATPDEHHHFVAWSDGNTDNPRNIIIQQDMVLTAQFALENTSVDKVTDCNVLIYVKGHILYIEGVDEEYNIFDTSGRLIYSGCDPQISLPQGLYLVKVGNTLKRVIL